MACIHSWSHIWQNSQWLVHLSCTYFAPSCFTHLDATVTIHTANLKKKGKEKNGKSYFPDNRLLANNSTAEDASSFGWRERKGRTRFGILAHFYLHDIKYKVKILRPRLTDNLRNHPVKNKSTSCLFYMGPIFSKVDYPPLVYFTKASPQA